MESIASTTSSTAPSKDDRSDADRAAFAAASHVRGIPTARTAAGSYTRASLDRAIADQQQDEPRPYDAVVLGGSDSLDRIGQPYAWGAL